VSELPLNVHRARIPAQHAALVFGCAVAVHLVAIAAPFTAWDDPLYVTENARVLDASLRGLVSLWSPRWALDAAAIEYFPLRDSLYWALHAAFGLEPAPYHALGFALHGLDAVLVSVLAAHLSARRDVALAAGMLFAVLPVHVESVVWIAGLKDPLFTLFFLLGSIAYLRFRDENGPRAPVALLAAVVLGFLSKALVVALPAVLFVVDRAASPARPRKATFVALAPASLVVVPFMALVVAIARANDVVSQYPGGSTWTGFLTSCWSVAVYLAKAFVPTELCTRYIVEPVLGLADPRAWMGFASLVIPTVLALWRWRRGDRIHLVAWCWYVITLLPVLNIVPKRVEVADRYQYAPSILLSLWLAVILFRVAVRLRVDARAVVAPVLTVYAAVTVQQANVWNDEVALWQQVVDQPTARAHSFAWNMYGNALERAGQRDEAKAAYAVGAAAPDGMRALPLAALARLALLDGNIDEALARSEESIRGEVPDGRIWSVRADALRRSGERKAAAQASARAAQASRTAVSWWNAAVDAVAVDDAAAGARFLAAALERDPRLCVRGRAFTQAQTDVAQRLLWPVVAATCHEGDG
jgi:hypothetical protein